jgi:hypothetical protein
MAPLQVGQIDRGCSISFNLLKHITFNLGLQHKQHGHQNIGTSAWEGPSCVGKPLTNFQIISASKNFEVEILVLQGAEKESMGPD